MTVEKQSGSSRFDAETGNGDTAERRHTIWPANPNFVATILKLEQTQPQYRNQRGARPTEPPQSINPVQPQHPSQDNTTGNKPNSSGLRPSATGTDRQSININKAIAVSVAHHVVGGPPGTSISRVPSRAAALIASMACADRCCPYGRCTP